MKKITLKIYLLAVLLSLGTIATKGQNLVLNPGFESYTGNCNLAGYGSLTNWYNPSPPPIDSCSSPDWYATCGGLPFNQAPNAYFGYQAPHGGNAYAAFILKDASTANYREYVEGKLSTPLTAGQTYCISFYVSLGNKAYLYCSNFGAYLSNTLTTFPWNNCSATAPLPFTPQINYTCTITDTANWVRVQGNYTAVGGEQYITIGNFFNDGATTSGTNNAGGFLTGPFAYYYVDDVSVLPGACCAADITPPTSMCLSASSTTLTATGSGSGACAQAVSGTWSGTGITNATTGVFNPTIAGTGSHVISYSMACGYTATTTITVNPCATLTVCANGSTLNVSGGTPSYTWQTQQTVSSCTACLVGCAFPPGCSVTVTSWTTAATGTSTFTPGSYPVKVFDSAGNSYTVTSLGAVPTCTTAACPSLTVSATTQSVACYGASNGSATVSTSGGTGPYTYTWSPGNLNGASQSSLAANTYTVSVKDNNGCTGTGTVNITQPASALTATITDSHPANCGGNNGSATAGESGGTPIYTYSWSPYGGTASIAHNLGGGTYTVAITDANGCVATATVLIADNVTTPTLSVNSATICAGSTTTLTANGAPSYTWSAAPELSATTGSVVVASPTVTTSYTVTGGLGTCTASVVSNVAVNSIPTLTVTAPALVCLGQTINLGVSPSATSYTWSGPNSFSDNTQNPSIPNATTANSGTYSITITDNGCSSTSSVSVTVVANPSITVNSVSICIGDSATLHATGASSYTWSPATGLSTTTGSVVTTKPSTLTIYTVTGTVGTCTAQAGTATVTVNTPPTVSVNSATICAGSSATLTATGANTYTWSPSTGLSATTGSVVNASPVTPSTYSVIGTDANGCKDAAIADIAVNASPTVTVNNAIICQGDSAALTAGGATSYTWTPSTGLSATTGTLVMASPSGIITNYSVTGTTGLCSNTAVATVTVIPTQTITITPSANPICAGTTATLIANGASTYTWSPAGGLSSTTSSTVTITPSGNVTYTVSGSVGTCSAIPAVITETVNALPTLTITPSTAICLGDSTMLMISGATTYSWTPATGLTLTTASVVTASPTNTTTYNVTGITNNCSSTASVVVTVNPLPIFTVNSASICTGNSTVLTASNNTPTYTWSPVTGLSASSGSVVTANPTSDQTYTITGTLGTCTSVAVASVTVVPNPTVTVNSATICAGSSAALIANGATTYTWSPSTGLSSTAASVVTASPANTTTYTVIGSISTCTDIVTTIVTVNNLPAVSAGLDAVICKGDSAHLLATGADSYVWTPATGLNNNMIANPSASPSITTNYTVVGTNTVTGCTKADAVTVTTSTLHATVSANPVTGDAPLTVTFGANGGASSYYWNYGNGTILSAGDTTQAIYPNPGTYTASVIETSAAGCKDSASVTIIVTEGYSIVIPNIITPNGDNTNDYFFVKHEGISALEMVIYDRWGLQMWQSSSLNGIWDGKHNGKDVPEGVYFYLIKATNSKTGETKDYQGFITLIK